MEKAFLKEYLALFSSDKTELDMVKIYYKCLLASRKPNFTPNLKWQTHSMDVSICYA